MQMPHVTRTLRTCFGCLLAAKAHASASRKSQMVPDEGFTSIALPRLATGVGGLAWDDVRPVIHDRLGALAIPVIVYAEFHAGQAATE